MAVTKLGGGEGGAWDKFMQGVNHASEAAMELAIYTDNPDWNKISLICKQMSDNARSLRGAVVMRRLS